MSVNKFENRSAATYDKKADHYEETFDGKFTVRFKNLLAEAVTVPNGGAVLDVACGNGRLLKMLAEKFSFGGYGADISTQMVEQAKALNPSMTFVAAGCDSLPFESGAFDVITVCAAYHHFPNVAAFAKEARRLLKPSGKIYIAEVLYPAVIRAICNPFVRLSKAGDMKFYAPAEIMRTLRSAGFRNADYKTDGAIQIVTACAAPIGSDERCNRVMI
jgi:ubiquinone/menaquinone biosynthesis C-methylase UbiE